MDCHEVEVNKLNVIVHVNPTMGRKIADQILFVNGNVRPKRLPKVQLDFKKRCKSKDGEVMRQKAF